MIVTAVASPAAAMARPESGRTLDGSRTALGYVRSRTADRRSLRRFSGVTIPNLLSMWQLRYRRLKIAGRLREGPPLDVQLTVGIR
jgi:hypothetical protein